MKLLEQYANTLLERCAPEIKTLLDTDAYRRGDERYRVRAVQNILTSWAMDNAATDKTAGDIACSTIFTQAVRDAAEAVVEVGYGRTDIVEPELLANAKAICGG